MQVKNGWMLHRFLVNRISDALNLHSFYWPAGGDFWLQKYFH